MAHQLEEIEKRLDELRDQFIAEFLRYLSLLDFDTSDVQSYVYVDEMPDGSLFNRLAGAFGETMLLRVGNDEINKFGRVFRRAWGDFESSNGVPSGSMGLLTSVPAGQL